MKSKNPKSKSPKTKLTWQGMKAFFGLPLGPALQVAIVLFFAGTVDLPFALLFLVMAIPMWSAGAILMLRKDPELLNLRGGWIKDKNYKLWDKALVMAFGLLAYYFTPLAVGLEAAYMGLPTLTDTFILGGFAVYAFSIFVFFQAMLANRFFEGGIRIQKDRQHVVVSAGPYSVVRHPAYMATIFMSVAFPIAMGSVFGVIPGIAAGALIVVRTYIEDRILMKELKGYKEYSQRIRYRLLSGLW